MQNEEHSPEPAPAPAQQSQVKNDRRTSWAISLGTRSGTRDGPQPPQSSHQHTRSVSDVAPQIPQPLRMSPFESDVGKDSPWAAPPGSQLSKTVLHQRSDSQADELVSPVSDTHSIPDRDHDIGGLSAPPATGGGQIAQGVAAGMFVIERKKPSPYSPRCSTYQSTIGWAEGRER